MNFILDTNAYSDYVRGDSTIVNKLNSADIVYMPVVVVGELKRGFYYGSRVSPNLAVLEKFIAKPRVRILEITLQTAEQFGRLSVYLKDNGTPIPINDVWIGALCVEYDLPLLTRDRDFENLPQITLI